MPISSDGDKVEEAQYKKRILHEKRRFTRGKNDCPKRIFRTLGRGAFRGEIWRRFSIFLWDRAFVPRMDLAAIPNTSVGGRSVARLFSRFRLLYLTVCPPPRSSAASAIKHRNWSGQAVLQSLLICEKNFNNVILNRRFLEYFHPPIC